LFENREGLGHRHGADNGDRTNNGRGFKNNVKLSDMSSCDVCLWYRGKMGMN